MGLENEPEPLIFGKTRVRVSTFFDYRLSLRLESVTRTQGRVTDLSIKILILALNLSLFDSKPIFESSDEPLNLLI